ncbi:hypothetical protein [Kitasatospora sp. NPDC004272]
MQEKEQAPGALFVRGAMARVTDELAEPVGLTAGAVREGRRRRLRARLAVGGAVVCTAALAVTGLAFLPGPTGGGAGPAPLQMAAAPTASPQVFPTTTVVPTASPDASQSVPVVPEAERQRIEDFRQRSANVLHDLLPTEIGSISLLSDQVSDYLAQSPQGDLLLRLSVRPHSDGAPSDGPCENTPIGQEVQVKTSTCKRVQVTGTITGTTWRSVDSDGLTSISVSFRLGNSDAYVGIMPYGQHRSSSPVPVDQVVAFAQQPRVMALLDEGDQHPVEEAQLSGPAYEE